MRVPFSRNFSGTKVTVEGGDVDTAPLRRATAMHPLEAPAQEHSEAMDPEDELLMGLAADRGDVQRACAVLADDALKGVAPDAKPKRTP